MLILELLGTLSLRDETRPVPVAAQQKRPLGLLAILGLGGTPGLSRDHSQSVIWLRRLANSDPFSAGATKKLMRALAAAGDRAGAVKHARPCTRNSYDKSSRWSRMPRSQISPRR